MFDKIKITLKLIKIKAVYIRKIFSHLSIAVMQYLAFSAWVMSEMADDPASGHDGNGASRSSCGEQRRSGDDKSRRQGGI
jgi:hypothetical protein